MLRRLYSQGLLNDARRAFWSIDLRHCGLFLHAAGR